MKKDKKNTANALPNKETFQRLNFLYQAAMLASNSNLETLGRFYATTLKTIGTKNVLRLDPSVKRNICKRCDGVLITGVTSMTSIKKRGGRQSVVTVCKACKYKKSLPIDNPSHELFHDKPQHEIIQLTNSR